MLRRICGDSNRTWKRAKILESKVRSIVPHWRIERDADAGDLASEQAGFVAVLASAGGKKDFAFCFVFDGRDIGGQICGRQSDFSTQLYALDGFEEPAYSRTIDGVMRRLSRRAWALRKRQNLGWIGWWLWERFPPVAVVGTDREGGAS
jgi:hypothetical protein